jgi:hypothetical protein
VTSSVARVNSSRDVKMQVSTKTRKESIDRSENYVNVNALSFSYTVCAVMTPWALARSMQFSSMCIAPSIPIESIDPFKTPSDAAKMRNGESRRKIYQKLAVTSIQPAAFTLHTP